MLKADASLCAAKGQGSGQKMVVQGGGTLSSRIPQLDGPTPDPYDDELSTPNIYNHEGGGVNEDDDDDDDESLNEDDDELDDVDNGEDLNTTHLVLAQFDKVTRTKSRWKCTLKDGIMHINGKDILFNKAMGEFNF